MARERTRPDVAAQRESWFGRLAGLDPCRLLFLDETWTKTNLTRSYGWGPCAERVTEAVPHGHWMTTTLLCAVRTEGVVAPLVVDGPINGELFLAWVRQHLAPALRPGDAVVLDNLSCHKVKGVREAIEAVGAKVLYLPPYSPDFNPIEPIFSWFKARLRGLRARTCEALWTAIGQLCDDLSPQTIAHCYTHCGYRAAPAA